jgi:hypothetical protein
VDPLNLSLHQAYWGLRRQAAGKGARRQGSGLLDS